MNEITTQSQIKSWRSHRILVVSILVLFLVGAIFFARSLPQAAKTLTSPQADQSNPRIVEHTVDPLFTDEVGVVEHRFPIVNSSSQVINIRTLNKSCSCTEASVTDTVVKPGQETHLTMKVDLHGRTATFTAECLVEHDRWRAVALSPDFANL